MIYFSPCGCKTIDNSLDVLYLKGIPEEIGHEDGVQNCDWGKESLGPKVLQRKVNISPEIEYIQPREREVIAEIWIPSLTICLHAIFAPLPKCIKVYGSVDWRSPKEN